MKVLSVADSGGDFVASATAGANSLVHALRELLAHLELEDLRKESKSARSKRLRECLGAFKDRLASDKSSAAGPRVADLTAKVRTHLLRSTAVPPDEALMQVEYLMGANDKLLSKQEQLESAFGERTRKLEAEEQELARRVELCLQDLLQRNRIPPSSEQGGAVPILRSSHPLETSTLTTRAGIYSASEKADWSADLQRFQVSSVRVGRRLACKADFLLILSARTRRWKRGRC